MLKKLRNSALVLAIATTGVCLYGGSAQADPTPTPTPVAIEVLTPRAAFTDHASMQIRLKAVGHGTDVIKVSDPSNVVATQGHGATRCTDSLAHSSRTSNRHHCPG